MLFLQHLVRVGIDIDGNVSSPIKANQFMLDAVHPNQPSMISVTFLSNGSVYEYSVEFSSIVYKETLNLFADGIYTIYNRQNDVITIGEAPNVRLDALSNALEHVILRPTQLFLNLAQGFASTVTPIKDAFDWFVSLVCIFQNQNTCSVVYPESIELDCILSELDLGINTVKYAPTEINEDLKQLVANMGNTKQISTVIGDDKITLESCHGVLNAKSLYTTHTGNSGQEVNFAYKLESDGTKQILELLPAIHELTKDGSSLVLVVDGIDLGLHPVLSMNLIRLFLEKRDKKSTSQLIATCHNPLILDQQLLRTDEVWMVERDKEGCSSIFSICECEEIDVQSNIQKLYFLGKLGGLPDIFII